MNYKKNLVNKDNHQLKINKNLILFLQNKKLREQL